MRRGERVSPARLTLAELVELWREARSPELKPRTIERYDYALDRHVLPRLGRRLVAEVNEDDVARLVTHLRAARYAAWTVRGDLVALSRVYSYGMRRGIAAFNPVAPSR